MGFESGPVPDGKKSATDGTGTSAPGSNGCSGAACTDSSHCRSEHGYCGSGPSYCNDKSTYKPTGCSSASTTAAPTTGAPTTAAPTTAATTAPTTAVPTTGVPTTAASTNSPSSIPQSWVGYYAWTWGSGSYGPPNANAGVAFSGWNNVDTAISQLRCNGPGQIMMLRYDSTKPALKGIKFLCIGGGNNNGIITVAVLDSTGNNAAKIKTAGYGGVILDVEEATGSAADLNAAFASALQKLKAEGLVTGITPSHSAPYKTDTSAIAVALVNAWVASDYLDFISPQMYTTGYETTPQYDLTSTCSPTCTWDLYKNAKPALAPSVVDHTHYAAVQSFFANKGITTKGFFQWAQAGTDEGLAMDEPGPRVKTFNDRVAVILMTLRKDK
eukprot:gene4912-2367_t